MSCNAHFEVILAGHFPPHNPQRESLRLQRYNKKMTYANFFTLLSQFEPFYNDTNKL